MCLKGIYTHLIPKRCNTTFLCVGNWKQSPEIKWKLQTRHPHSSVQFPFFPYWYHFPFHLSNLHWNILIDFKAQFPIPSYLGLGTTLTLSYVEVALSEVSFPAPIVITSCRKNKTIITKILFFVYIASSAVFSHFFPEKSWDAPVETRF